MMMKAIVSIAFLCATLISLTLACKDNSQCDTASECCFFKPWMGPEGMCSPWKKEGDSCAGAFNGCPCGQGLSCITESNGKFCRKTSSSRGDGVCYDDTDCDTSECCFVPLWSFGGSCKKRPTIGMACTNVPFKACPCATGTSCQKDPKEPNGYYCLL